MKSLSLIFLLLVLGASASANSDDAKGVLILSGTKDSIRLNFTKDAACSGLHEVPWDYRNKESFAWGLSIAGDGAGHFEVLLINSESSPHHYVFLGENIKKGVHKACRVINGEENVVWLSFQK